jgi:GTP cyclohydrolase I
MNNELLLTNHLKDIIQLLGENPEREGLRKTPERSAKTLRFLTEGYRKEKEVISDCMNALFDEKVTSVVAVNNIEFYSLCEHHLLPFWGSVSIAFLPNKNGKILGLSKFGRLVDLYSRRLQVQERLTEELVAIIWKILKPQAVCVRIRAEHMCMMMRGVEKQRSHTSIYQFKGNTKFKQTLKEELEK